MNDINETIEKSMDLRKEIEKCLKNYDTSMDYKEIMIAYRQRNIFNLLASITALMTILLFLMLIK